MSEWGLIGQFFEQLQSQSTLLGRFWLFIMLVFRIVILGTVASELFEDEQEQFVCNTLQPGCNQVCYDKAFPISQYRFWVFHIVIIATPPIIFLMCATHHQNKKKEPSKTSDQELNPSLRKLYLASVLVRTLAEIGFLVGQVYLFGFEIKSNFSCEGFPCPKIVDCFVSRPTEKTIFLCFYFAVGVVSAGSGCLELIYSSLKWFCRDSNQKSHNQRYILPMNEIQEEHQSEKMEQESQTSSLKQKHSLRRSIPSRKNSYKNRKVSHGTNGTIMV